MKSVVVSAAHARVGSGASRSLAPGHGSRSRPLVRLLGLGLAAALAAGLAITAAPATALAATGDWPQFHNGPAHQGNDAQETTLSAANVASLAVAWTGNTAWEISSSPVVADGVVYVGSWDKKLHAYKVGCNSGGGTCTSLWTGATDQVIDSSPAVAGGVVYVATVNGTLYAFAVGCASGGGTCTPIWTSDSGSYVDGTPTVTNGVVYVGSGDGKVYAFKVDCNSGGGTCTPLWTAATLGSINAALAVAGGVVYAGSDDGKLYAYKVGCNSGGGTCSPIWKSNSTSGIASSPAVANGVVYVRSKDARLAAYKVGCNSGGGSCSPIWTGDTGLVIAQGNIGEFSSPAVADGVVYVGSLDKKLYAFKVGCNTGGGTCTPLWTGATGDQIFSSPAVANGVVYVGSWDHKLYAFKVGCASGGGTCKPLWKGTTGDGIISSPAVANGVVYVGSDDDKLYAFGLPKLPGATYVPVVPNRLVDSRAGTRLGLSASLKSGTPATFQVTGRVPSDATKNIPTSAIAVTGNLTVTGQGSKGYFALTPNVPSGTPGTSTLNFPTGDNRANGVTVQLGTGGKLTVTFVGTAGKSADVIFDVTGYFLH